MQLTELIRAEVKLSVDRCSVGAFFAVLLCSVSLGAQPHPRNYDHFDIRLEPSVQTGRAFSASASTDAASFPRAEYDLGGPLTAASSGDLDLVARRFLENSSKDLGALRSFGLDVEIVSRSESREADLTHIVFRPTYLGIPYFDADLSVHLDGEGRVWRLNRDTHPFPPAGLSTSVDARAAVERALAALGFEPKDRPAGVGEVSGPDRRAVFRYQGLGRIPVSLVWFPTQPAALAAWQLYVEGPGRAYLVVVDAANGEILFSRNLTSRSSPLGRVFRVPDHPHPDAAGQTDEAFTGWPTSVGSCPADIYPAQFQAGSQAGRCWVESDETRGNNADVCLDAVADNICDTRAQDNAAHFLFNFSNDYDTANNPVRTARRRSSTPSIGSTPCMTATIVWASTSLPGTFRTTTTTAAGPPGTRCAWTSKTAARRTMHSLRRHPTASRRAWKWGSSPACAETRPSTAISSRTSTRTV